MVNCKYEKLGDLCFICGLLSYTERFCRTKLETTDGEIVKEWGHWLRAPPRRVAGGSKSKWLREEGAGDWGPRKGMDNHSAENQGIQKPEFARPTTNSRIQRDKVSNSAKSKSHFTPVTLGRFAI